MIKYTDVASLIVVIWFVFAVYGLIVFMVYWTIASSEPCQTYEMDIFVKTAAMR